MPTEISTSSTSTFSSTTQLKKFDEKDAQNAQSLVGLESKAAVTPSSVKPTDLGLDPIQLQKEMEKEVAVKNKKKSSELDISGKPRYKPLLEVTVGTTTFTNLKGDFLGRPKWKSATSQHEIFAFVLNDPEDTLRPSISVSAEVQVKCGFGNNEKEAEILLDIFKGKIFHLGRLLPDGCLILAVDDSFQMQSMVGSSIQPASTPLPETAPPPGGDFEVTSTFQGEISFYADDFHGRPTASGKKFDMNALTAAHKQLPFGTKLRVTNIDPKFKSNNGKSVIVEINDRGPYIAGRVVDLSKAAGAAIGLTIKEGHILAKCEVLGKAKAPAVKPASTPAAGATPPPTGTAKTAPPPPPQAAHDIAKPTEAGATASGNSFQDLLDKRLALALSPREKQTTAAAMEVFAAHIKNDKDPKLQFSFDSDIRIATSGSIRNEMSQMAAATLEALKQGDVVIGQGGTVKQIAPGRNEASGVVLNYESGRAAFIGKPEIIKRTGLQLRSGYGQFSVTGFDVNNKRPVGATIVTPLEPGPHPTGQITVPDWGAVKLNDPLYPGCLYTWADVTKNGTRVPTKAVMQGAIKLAQAIHPLHAKYSGGKPWNITSWYRPPEVNANTKGAAKNSRHLYGDAIDFSFPGCFGAFWQYVKKDWVGGYCIYSSWMHLDVRGYRQTWSGG